MESTTACILAFRGHFVAAEMLWLFIVLLPSNSSAPAPLIIERIDEEYCRVAMLLALWDYVRMQTAFAGMPMASNECGSAYLEGLVNARIYQILEYSFAVTELS